MLSKERMLSRFLEMTRIYSPSRGEKEMADWIEGYLASRGISFTSDDSGRAYGGNGRNIVAHLPGTLPGGPIGFMAHMDQIEPCSHVNAVIEGNVVRTDGTTTLGGDDKGGIAIILEALEDLLESKVPHRDIWLIFTCAEETNMLGVKHMDMRMLPKMDVLIPDAGGKAGIIAWKAPAKEEFCITFHGRKAHAGIEPENGINAVVASAKAISKMHIGRLSPETTSNIGRIEGGDAVNVVTDMVTFHAEIRSHDMQALEQEIAHMEACCRDAAEEMGACVNIVRERSYPALNLAPECDFVLALSSAMQAEGIEPQLIVSGGGFDGNILSERGFRCAALGFGMSDVHTVNEYLDLDEAYKCCRVLRRMMSME